VAEGLVVPGKPGNAGGGKGPWFKADAYYRQQREKGSSYQVAVRALAFKWIRILYRCWQTRTPYDEATYLNALRKRGSPLLKNLTLNAENA
jgi:hypothetical protein